jgi:hypothetical protein
VRHLKNTPRCGFDPKRLVSGDQVLKQRRIHEKKLGRREMTVKPHRPSKRDAAPSPAVEPEKIRRRRLDIDAPGRSGRPGSPAPAQEDLTQVSQRHQSNASVMSCSGDGRARLRPSR